MTKEELMEEARRRYPLGTRYYDANPKTMFPHEEFSIVNDLRDLGTDDYSAIHGGWGYVYYHGHWAKLVEPEIKTNYQIF